MAKAAPKKKTPSKKSINKISSHRDPTVQERKSPSVLTLARHLAAVLSDTYVLAVKTHGYHWNVMGPQFGGLHAFFEEQYNELIKAADEIAERIRALGMMPDGSMDAFLQNTVVKEAGIEPITAEEMLKDLFLSHRLVRNRAADAKNLADEVDDDVTQDLMVQRMAAHDKTLWMIHSYLS